MAVVRHAVDRLSVTGPVPSPTFDAGRQRYEPCDLLVAEPVGWGHTDVGVDTVWAAELEVNAVASFQAVQPPWTIVEINVARLADAPAAAAAGKQARTGTCPGGPFRLTMGTIDAIRESRTLRIGATDARSTTATVQRVDPAFGLNLVPGDARLTFAHGALLVTVEVLRLWPGHADPPKAITDGAQRAAVAIAADIMTALPASAISPDGPTPG